MVDVLGVPDARGGLQWVRATTLMPVAAAIAETLSLIAFVCGVQFLFIGTLELSQHVVHPFWLPVLLVTMQYGAREGVVSALLCGAASLMCEPTLIISPYTALAPQAFATPALWLFSAAGLGAFRDRERERIAALERAAALRETRIETLSESGRALQDELDSLHLRIAVGDASPLPSTLDAIRVLRAASADRRERALGDTLQLLVGASDFALFRLEGARRLAPVVGDGAIAARYARRGLPNRAARAFARGKPAFADSHESELDTQRLLVPVTGGNQRGLSGVLAVTRKVRAVDPPIPAAVWIFLSDLLADVLLGLEIEADMRSPPRRPLRQDEIRAVGIGR